jgi:hypothetical protein
MLRLLLVHELIGEKLESQSLGIDGLHSLIDGCFQEPFEF